MTREKPTQFWDSWKQTLKTNNIRFMTIMKTVQRDAQGNWCDIFKEINDGYMY
jgi:hypothetical protein